MVDRKLQLGLAIFAALAIATLALQTSARPLTSDDECISNDEGGCSLGSVTIIGHSISPAGGVGGGGGGGGQVIYFDAVYQETMAVMFTVKTVVDLQCPKNDFPAWTNRTVEDLKRLGRTTSLDAWDRRQDAAAAIVAVNFNLGSLGQMTYRGRTTGGEQVTLATIRFADGGTETYIVRPLSAIKAEPLSPGVVPGINNVYNPGNGVPVEANCNT